MAGVHRADLELLELGSAIAVAAGATVRVAVLRGARARVDPCSTSIARFSLSRSDINMDRI